MISDRRVRKTERLSLFLSVYVLQGEYEHILWLVKEVNKKLECEMLVNVGRIKGNLRVRDRH